MSRFAFFKTFRYQEHEIRGTTSAVLTMLSTTTTRIVLCVFIALCGVVYIWLVNSSATAGFYLSDLEQRVAALDEEYRTLELQKTELQSLRHIEEQSKAMNLLVSTEVQYVDTDQTVALGR